MRILVYKTLIRNSAVLKARINNIGLAKIKTLFIKRYNSKKSKFKGFLI